jgi:hypothetical protein
MRKFSFLLLILALVSLSFGIPLSKAAATDEVQLFKVADSDNTTLGENITYTYTIVNNTGDNLTGLQLLDDKIGNIDIPDQLSAGDSITVTRSYSVSQSDYSDNANVLVNIATLTGSENITVTATESVALNPYKGSLQVFKEANRDSATVGDTITYTYRVINNGLVEIISISLIDDKLGAVPLVSDNVTVLALAPGDSVTATASYKIVFSDVLAGAVNNTATVTGVDPDGRPVSANSDEIVVSTNVIKSLLNKAETLRLSGVPGKGIESAPGLQKPFNPNSQAGEHAGKKDGNGSTEKNKGQETNGNSGQNQEQGMNNNSGKGHGKNNK